MEAKETIDKSSWGDGPWQSEPDRVEWRTAAGLLGLITRVPNSGILCGYVMVPPGHPLHGVTYHDAPVYDLMAHGGITYSASCRDNVCHVPAPGEPDDVWWIGFDTGHAGDYMPGHEALFQRIGRLSWRENDVYRDVVYVRAEVEQLAAQIAVLS